MAFSAPNFVSRLMRPFTQSTRLALSPDASGSAINLPEGAEKAIVAAGCFWGVEHIFRKHFKGKGLLDARVGYIGGTKANPTYSQVTDRDRTGRASSFPTLFLFPFRPLRPSTSSSMPLQTMQLTDILTRSRRRGSPSDL
jgi:peptide-methionine (S)-S-oxide reductase